MSNHIYCCIEFSRELHQGLLEYRDNPEYGKVGYYFACDCEAAEFYQETEVITYCPFCGIPMGVMKAKREAMNKKK